MVLSEIPFSRFLCRTGVIDDNTFAARQCVFTSRDAFLPRTQAILEKEVTSVLVIVIVFIFERNFSDNN